MKTTDSDLVEDPNSTDKFTFIAFCTAGLEGAASLELKKMGYKISFSSSGRIFFNAPISDVPILNMKLKTVDRLALLLCEFEAHTFDDLYENIYKQNLKEIIDKNGKITIEKIKVSNSKLSATGAIASVAKKAIIDSIHGSNETGPEYPFIVILKNDKAYLLLDTTGKDGLHKRGYRLKSTRAPLRETIAAAVVLLSRWNENIPLFDPFCGSGTILIEAALLNIPNVHRMYVSEQWKILKEEWKKLKAKLSKKNFSGGKIYGSDVDCNAIEIAKQNYARAKSIFNVNYHIEFICTDFKKLKPVHDSAYVISNLPYGQRLDIDILSEIRLLRQKFKDAKYYLLHPSDKFENYFGKATKKFKFQNSGIWTYMYMYY